MNDYPTASFVEQAARWLQSTEFVLYVGTGVVLLFYQFPAYKRFRTRALMLLVISCALDVFITIFDHTIGQYGSSDPDSWWVYYFCREVTWIAAVIIGTVGALMFLRDYARLATTAGANPPSPAARPTRTHDVS